MAKYLIDTHIYIWATSNTAQLAPKFAKITKSLEHEIYLSMASLWEMQIKYQLGRLKLAKPLKFLIEEIHQENLYKILPITESHVLNLQNLPDIHNDPFDRLLISQAMTENLTMLTVDKDIIQYPIDFIH